MARFSLGATWAIVNSDCPLITDLAENILIDTTGLPIWRPSLGRYGAPISEEGAPARGEVMMGQGSTDNHSRAV